MRKIPEKYENIIDNKLIDLSEYVSSTFYNNGFTPNMITTLSNISAFLVIIFLIKSKFYLAAFFVMVSYFFDCLDGYFARKYNMTSNFGDYYDHISDFIKSTAILTTLYFINPLKFFKIIPILTILLFLMIRHIGCQEKYYNTDESNTLDFTKKLCPVDKDKNIEDKLKYTRYFGCGTFYLVLALCVIYYDY